MKHEVLRLEDITYFENGRRTLDRFYLNLYKGEVLGVFSNHASVKTSLIALITGKCKADGGRLYIGDTPCHFEEKAIIRQQRITLIDAKNTLIDSLTVADNIFVIRRNFKHWFIENGLIRTQTRMLMEDFGLDIHPRTLASQLSTLERYMVELVKAYALGAEAVILKDMSTYLSDHELDRIHGLVCDLQTKGMAFLMVDSSVNQLRRYADRVVVIKKGRNSWTFQKDEFCESVLKSHFYRQQDGRDGVHSLDESTSDAVEEQILLSFEGIETDILSPVTFSLKRGEALSIFDGDGKGIEEINALLSGTKKPDSGRIIYQGARYAVTNPWRALEKKVAFIPENPAETSLFKHFTALENLCYPSSTKVGDFWINPMYLSSCRREYAGDFEPGELDRHVDELPMQTLYKLVYVKWHLYNPALVVCTKPFSSVDKSLKDISARYLQKLLDKGIAVLILTSNYSEVGISCEKISITTKE